MHSSTLAEVRLALRMRAGACEQLRLRCPTKPTRPANLTPIFFIPKTTSSMVALAASLATCRTTAEKTHART